MTHASRVAWVCHPFISRQARLSQEATLLSSRPMLDSFSPRAALVAKPDTGGMGLAGPIPVPSATKRASCTSLPPVEANSGSTRRVVHESCPPLRTQLRGLTALLQSLTRENAISPAAQGPPAGDVTGNGQVHLTMVPQTSRPSPHAHLHFPYPSTPLMSSAVPPTRTRVSVPVSTTHSAPPSWTDQKHFPPGISGSSTPLSSTTSRDAHATQNTSNNHRHRIIFKPQR